MKARLPKGYGRPDPNAMMRQVQKMQDDIRAKQEELDEAVRTLETAQKALADFNAVAPIDGTVITCTLSPAPR